MNAVFHAGDPTKEMNNTGPRSDRTGREIASQAVPFKKVLLSFADGDISFSDAQADLLRLLGAGAVPDDLREVMRRYESMEPLPDYAREELLRILDAAAPAATPAAEEGTAPSSAPTSPKSIASPAPTAASAQLRRLPIADAAAADAAAADAAAAAVVAAAVVAADAVAEGAPRPRAVAPAGAGDAASLDDSAAAQQANPALGGTSSPPPSLADKSKLLERRIARQKADYQELTHTYERARDAGSAAAARAIAVSADLSAVRSALEAEQRRNRDNELALADAAAAHEAASAALVARDAALAELDAALAARDSTIDELRRELAERDPQAASRLESALAEERAHATALDAQLAQAQSLLETEQNLNRAGERALAEADAAHKAVAAALAAQDAAVAALEATVDELRRALAERESQTAALDVQLTEATAAAAAARTHGDEATRAAAGYQAQLQAANEALASRDVVLGQLRSELEEREARVHTLATELAAARASVDWEQRKAREALADQAATAQTVRAQAEAARREHAAIVAALERRANALESELQSTKNRVGLVVTPPPAATALPATALPDPNAPPQSHVPLEPHIWDAEPETAADAAASTGSPARPVLPRWLDAARTARGLGVAGVARGLRAAHSLRAPRGRVAAVGAAVAVLLLVLLLWSFGRHAPVPESGPDVATAPTPAPGTVIHDCPTCPALTVVPAGRFKMGSLRTESVSSSFERPLHWVLFNHAFALSTNAVSVDEFRIFAAATGRDMRGCDVYDDKWHVRADAGWENPGFAQTGAHPVTCVSWADATAYAQWLSKSTGHRYRLPSASEWEYAARAGSEAVQPWNSDAAGACDSANVADQHAAKKYPGWAVFPCDDGYTFTAPGGSFKANAFGLNDMLGNVFQWTGDCWNADYTGAPSDGSARTTGDCGERELRGGSWFTTPNFVRATYRNHFGANYRSTTQGIRLARELSP